MTIRPMRVALGQMNAPIGDFAGNGSKIEALWKEAEAERQQAAPGLRVSAKAFGSGRRIPIAQVSKT